MRINSISINGNLTSDPEGKELPNQNYMARFSIAHNDREKKGDEWVAVAHFFDCLAWGKPAKILCDQVRKGDPIAVTGNAADYKTGKVKNPAAPSFLAVDAATGKILWQDSSPGDRISPRVIFRHRG